MRVQLVFEGETYEAAVSEVHAWLARQDPGQLPVQEDRLIRREREVREVLAGINGPDSRRFVRELAEAAVQGRGVRFDAELKARYRKTTGTAFAGIIGAANKVARRLLHRDLVVRDPALGGYRMDPLDATVVLAAWPPDGDRRPGHPDPPGAMPAVRTRPRGIPIDQVRPRRG